MGPDRARRPARGRAGQPFDLVLLDLGLPDLDGVEVCRQLRTAQPEAVIVILTARDEEMDVIVGLEAGADDYLTKPVRLAELHARVRAHLRRVDAGLAARRHRLGPARRPGRRPASRRVTIAGAEVPPARQGVRAARPARRRARRRGEPRRR